MAGLSAAASVIAVVDISAKVTSLCFQYSVANVLEKLQQLLDEQDKSQISTTRKIVDSLEGCHQQLQGLKAQLEPGRGRKAMQRVGIRALKWPFMSKQVEKMVVNLEQYEHAFSLALQVDQT
ncbi:hypothetical protein K458DRAFT_388312 [Lentithecium fluviatile CBS 122367]|uniref:Fungal N-terminal domain-containing protein n=1 Tax=Lentithecium fluviatile CBS 122367 TaxID=1168545 RepID=A0A6G1J4J1_9PLEO|nr:hypothetical protein K458DRAFT_388312 [Lentithecium fluviatile CBS 122367]